MSNYKVVDADQLDADLTAVADRIRARNGTDANLEFPQEYIDGIDAIKTPLSECSFRVEENGVFIIDAVEGIGFNRVRVAVDVPIPSGYYNLNDLRAGSVSVAPASAPDYDELLIMLYAGDTHVTNLIYRIPTDQGMSAITPDVVRSGENVIGIQGSFVGDPYGEYGFVKFDLQNGVTAPEITGHLWLCSEAQYASYGGDDAGAKYVACTQDPVSETFVDCAYAWQLSYGFVTPKNKVFSCWTTSPTPPTPLGDLVLYSGNRGSRVTNHTTYYCHLFKLTGSTGTIKVVL